MQGRGVQMSLRLTSRTLARNVVARRLVSARPRPFSQYGARFHQVRPFQRWAPVVVFTSKGDSMIDAEVEVAEQLGNKLSMLDETLEALQAQLEVGEAGQEEDKYLLSQLVEEVKEEQQAWIEETQAMDKLLKGAAGLEKSEAEVVAMTKQYNTMKRKVDLFTGLLHERAREVGDLRCQLEDIKLIGEVKQIKDKMEESRQEFVKSNQLAVEQLVAAAGVTMEAEASVESPPTPSPGSAIVGATVGAAVEAAVEAEASVDSAPTSSYGHATVGAEPTSVDSTPTSPPAPGPDRPPPEPIKLVPVTEFIKILSETSRTSGLETPGLVIASVVMGAGHLFSMLWSGISQNMPNGARVGVEMAAFVGASVAAVSVATSTTL